MPGDPPRPSRRLLLRGFLVATAGLALLLLSSFAMPEDVASRNDGMVWPAIIGIFSGLGGAVIGAGIFLAGVVKRLREPRRVRPPGTKTPTAGQAAAIVGGSAIFALTTCGAFAGSLESNSNYAALLLIGGAVGFLAATLAFFYGLVMLGRRLFGR